MTKIQRRTHMGCPCGHTYGEPCVIDQPLHLREACPLPCHEWGLELHAYNARTYGICPCAIQTPSESVFGGTA